MKKIKVLGIAPFESMSTLMLQAGAKRNDISLTVYTGDLEDGAAIASRYTQNDFDFIISRGGTAQLIRQVSSIPVIEITISLYDLLRCIQLAQSASNHYALIGFPNITKNTHFINTLLNYKMDIYTIHNQKEAEKVLKDIASSDIEVILSDSISNSLAKSYHFRSILITSGTESIDATFEQVVSYGNMYKETHSPDANDPAVFWKLIRLMSMYSVPEGEMIYHSRDDLYSRELTNIMAGLVPSRHKRRTEKGIPEILRHPGFYFGIPEENRRGRSDPVLCEFQKGSPFLLKNGLIIWTKRSCLTMRKIFILIRPLSNSLKA